MAVRKKKPSSRRAKPVAKGIHKAISAPARPAHAAHSARAAPRIRRAPQEADGPDAYAPGEDEEYMCARQLDFFRRRIERMREDIGQGVERTMASMQEEAGAIPDDNDRASKESEFAVELRQRDRDRRLLGKISRALEGIQDGSFGYCQECGDPIGVARLLARPVASLCIECKDLQERLEKNRAL